MSPFVRGGGAALFILLVLFSSAMPVFAQAPQLPHAFYGSVEINGAPAPVGAQVEGRAEGVKVGVPGNPLTTTVEGKYGSTSAFEPRLLVQGTLTTGTPIEFYVNGQRASVSVSGGIWRETFLYEVGGVTELNLRVGDASVTSTPAATSTAVPPTATLAPSATTAPTVTVGAGTPSPTPVTPTATLLPSATLPATATATVRAATATAAPTQVKPTATKPPAPTATVTLAPATAAVKPTDPPTPTPSPTPAPAGLFDTWVGWLVLVVGAGVVGALIFILRRRA